MADADVIVIGSGFGGAVTSCRLAQAGASVIVLERGREWGPDTFPRKPTDPWVFDPANPAARNGWFDMRIFPHMTVATGAGVGGGSLVYANISVEAKRDSFDAGWPPEITYDALAPHYAEVGRMMEIAPVPQPQWPARTKLLKEAAEAAGWGPRFRTLGTAVRYDPAWSYDLPNPHDPARSKTVTNIHGVTQGTCVHLGQCDIGCPVKARNTLDLNYLAVAAKAGAKIRPLHLVRGIKAVAGGYEVAVDQITGGALKPLTLTAPRVIVAAGSIGSTELLLRSKAGLPNLSLRLGRGWSSNGDFLTPAIHPLRDVLPTRGPTITAAIDLLDGAYQGQSIFIEDGGLPDPAADQLRAAAGNPHQGELMQRVTASLMPILSAIDVIRHVMPWFAQSRDAADGVITVKNGLAALDWDITASQKTIDAVVSAHQKLAQLTGGLPLTPLTWTLGHDLITPHPLGGCNMGTSAATGVVDFKGEVFGYPNLFVADGAVVPKALGLNPSRTIAALAEHIAAGIVARL
ncbi:MAG TPA: GMC oxidoreductase [Vicinamibacterales bacterium]|nr:GMC oxidoreductase [Vicinamibacterales bacterium]